MIKLLSGEILISFQRAIALLKGLFNLDDICYSPAVYLQCLLLNLEVVTPQSF